MSLHSRCLSASPGIVQPANPAMDSQLLDISTVQLVYVPFVDQASFGLYICLRSSRHLASYSSHLVRDQAESRLDLAFSSFPVQPSYDLWRL
jgi:hypothetical protein